LCPAISVLDERSSDGPGRHHFVGLHRAVCDYLAGMTDRYVMIEYQRVFGRSFV